MEPLRFVTLILKVRVSMPSFLNRCFGRPTAASDAPPAVGPAPAHHEPTVRNPHLTAIRQAAANHIEGLGNFVVRNLESWSTFAAIEGASVALACTISNMILPFQKGPTLPPEMLGLPHDATHSAAYTDCVNNQLIPNGLSDPLDSAHKRGLREIAPSVPASWFEPTIPPRSQWSPIPNHPENTPSSAGPSSLNACINLVARSWLHDQALGFEPALRESIAERLWLITGVALGGAALSLGAGMALPQLLYRMADALRAAPLAHDEELGAAAAPAVEAGVEAAAAQPENQAPPANPRPQSRMGHWLKPLMFLSFVLNDLVAIGVGAYKIGVAFPLNEYDLSFDVRRGQELSDLSAQINAYRQARGHYLKDLTDGKTAFSLCGGVLFISAALYVGNLANGLFPNRRIVEAEEVELATAV